VDTETRLRLEQLNDAFRPAGPVDQERLFAGRTAQRDRITADISTPGQHVAVFGERGVGKTSLAAVSVNAARQRGLMAMRVNCSPDDDFQLIWDAVVDQVVEQRDMSWWNPAWASHVEAFASIMGRETSVLAEPDRIRLALTRLSQATRVLVFFDEYDQIENEDVSRQMASTIKTLSDHLVDATIAIVGVAANIDELTHGHPSIPRCLDQIYMPRMSSQEIGTIVTRGLTELNMEAAPGALNFIVRVALGFPQYAHLLGRAFAKSAILRGSPVIEASDVRAALEDAVATVEQSVQAAYNAAVFSPNSKAIYKQVLLSCALANTDSEGFFPPRALADDLSFFLNRDVRSDTYNNHLIEFVESRGPILERRGEPKRWRYRFRDPAMAPYVILLGALDGLIMFAGEDSQVPPLPDEPATGQEPLF
jgi:Cdc6-like AAA superfamily ATPase